MALQIKYDEQFAGVKAVATRNGAQVIAGAVDNGTVYTVNKGDYVFLTGYYYYVGNAIYPQSTAGYYLLNVDGGDWQGTPNATNIPTYTQTQAQYIVDKLIKNNILIVQNNLVCARYADKFTAEQRQLIRDLQTRAEQRKQALLEQGLCTDVQVSYPAGYAELSASLDRLMSNGGVGSVTWATVVVVAMVIAAVATAAYFAYKLLYDESVDDVKYSKQLTAILAQKLTDEEYAQLLAETQGMVTKAKLRGSLTTFGSMATAAAFALAGYYLVKAFKSKRQ